MTESQVTSPANRPSWYRRLFAWGMSQMTQADENSIRLKDCQTYNSAAELKQTLLGDLRGRVLEIGPGAGINFPYYSPEIEWIGIEPNDHMRPYLEREAQKYGLNIQVYQQDAEGLPVADNSIDAVVSTYVLCSVDRLDETLRDIRRVLKPGGRLIFYEHVADPNESWLRRLQRGIRPLWKWAFDGCHPDRETAEAIADSGFDRVDYYRFRIWAPIVSPHVAGVAIEPE